MNFEEIKKKIEELKRSETVDLSTEEDLSIAVMNLISLEEHFFFTAQKTGKDNYLNLLNQAREMRKKLLARLIPEHEGETWCVSKHLLAATMRLMEVGAKLYSDKREDEAREIFSNAGTLYSLFWGLRLKLIDVSDLKEQAAAERPWTLKDIMDKLVNCCDE